MLTRVLHVSDLHFGRHEDKAAHEALADLVAKASPELVVCSGDVAHRGRRDQLERGGAFLRGLGRPVLVVPGNHDLPYTFPARFLAPWAEFRRQFETTEPLYASDAVYAVGLNSARPWRHQSGGIRDDQLARAAELFENAPATACRVAVLHHHLLGAPWRSRKKPVARRNHVLASLVESGAELILAGHIHQSTVCERREFEIATPGGERAVVVAIAPGFGQPRPRRRGEARGLHVYEVRRERLVVNTFVWREDGWGLTAVRRFPRGREPLAFEPEPAL